MKHFILLLSALALLTACGTTRRVSASEGTAAWEGRTTSAIIRAMGDPARIDPDGKGGSILVYESAPDYSSPDYDILAPETSAAPRRYARFYLDNEGVCYRVDTNRTLPVPTDSYRSFRWLFVPFAVDVLVYLPLLVLGAIIF